MNRKELFMKKRKKHWVSGISYVNASCTTMTQMTLDYLVPFGIIVG